MTKITKPQLADLVDGLYRSYNDQLPATEKNRKAILQAWWHELEHLSFGSVADSIRWHKIHNPTFMAKPTQIRTTAEDLESPNPPPTTAEAWQIYLDTQTSNNYGNWTPVEHHPALQKTITVLASAKLNPQSPRDREFFAESYQQNVTNWRHQTKSMVQKVINKK